MKIAIVTAQTTVVYLDNKPWCDCGFTELLMIVFDTNTVYSLDSGIECDIVDRLRFFDLMAGIKNNVIPAKVIDIPINNEEENTEKFLTPLETYLNNETILIDMLATIYNIGKSTLISFTYLSSLLGIDRNLAKSIVIDYLIPNNMIEKYSSQYKVTDNNKVIIRAETDKLKNRRY